MMRSRLFTLVCILAMLLGLVAAAAAHRVGDRRDRPADIWPAAGSPPERSAPPAQPTSSARILGDSARG